MKEETKHIKFQKEQDSKNQFDVIKIEELYHRTIVDHSIEIHHKVEFFVILFVEEGTGSHTIDFIDYPCSKGTLLTIRKDQIHKFNTSGNLKGSLLIFTDDFLINYLEKLEAHKSLLLFNEFLANPKIQLNDSEFADIKKLIRHIESEYFETIDSFQMSIIRSALHILVTKLFRIKSKKEKIDVDRKYLTAFITFQNLVENNTKQTTKVKDFASEMNISTKTLNTITRSVVHKSAKEFIDEICTKQIKRLLINTEFSIKEIAYQSGFDETTNFYKYFKRQTQSTPERFRANR